MIFCVFSFNRGRYLENCIGSIEACAPGSPIVIFDDNSTDPETVQVLEKFRAKHRIIQPQRDERSRHHLGGLYGNMQRAFEEHLDADLVCYLQDDTQMVRRLDEDDLAGIEQTFEKAPSLGFINPCFIRGINFTRGAQYAYNPELKLYFREHSQRSSGTYFSALLIMKPKRLKDAGWSFAQSEPANNQQARNQFMPMGYLHSPFAMWLPEVPAYRGKKKTLGLKLAEKKRNCGYYPFALMSESQITDLKGRHESALPIAEDFLHCADHEPPKPWAYNPLTNTGWIKTLNQAEVSLRRLFK
ncbi:glycosyltransferase family 2 protein [Marinobacter sp. F4216]|uniref:glycosyltransferase family 2 protein n=1 Tax=Marinobacter sp. F4216 TaxID=2874281 RepID=UPI001CBD1A7F|nr:glycosyltransferase family A protein [Marinobacter sp. F4216]MBZ2170173.1 glycosyltransferase family 2 protein [Marinobacter sp. F4216]